MWSSEMTRMPPSVTRGGNPVGVVGRRWDHRGMIEVTGLVKTFDTGRGRRRRRVEAVRDIGFAVEPGERVAYIGPNGAGKSTSIKILTGILHATSGDVRVLGLVPWRERRRLTRRIGTLFGQRSQLWFELTPRQSFRMLAAIHGLDTPTERERVAGLADLLDAADLFDVPVRNLSLGQRMRCELAACMLHRPDIMFLDEPTIGLDLLAKQRFRDLLVRLNAERGTTIFLTSHDVADVEVVARRAIVINHGSVIYDAEVAAMRRTLLATKLIEVGLSAPVEDPARAVGAARAIGAVGPAGPDAAVSVVEHTATVVRLVVDTARRPVRDVLDALLDAWPVADISVVDPPLEQVIAEIYGTPGAPAPSSSPAAPAVPAPATVTDGPA
jgi:ABC-2 type transport system ATP-binding protein